MGLSKAAEPLLGTRTGSYFFVFPPALASE